MRNNLSIAVHVTTCSRDIIPLQRLINSFSKHNLDNLPLIVSYAKHEADAFKNFQWKFIEHVEFDESEKDFFDPRFKVKLENGTIHESGWMNQQLRKIYLCKNSKYDIVLTIDSDFEFIRDFCAGDVVPDFDTYYFFGGQNRDLIMDSEYYGLQFKARIDYLVRIRDILGLDIIGFDCHSGQIMYRKVIRQITEHLSEVNLDWKKALTISPYEFNWYTYFIQTKEMASVRLDSPFKVIHSRKQLGNLLMQNQSVEDIARGYIGVVLNGNLFRNRGKFPGIRDLQFMDAGNFIGLKIIFLILVNALKSRILGTKW